jgi:hypothetical protein
MRIIKTTIDIGLLILIVYMIVDMCRDPSPDFWHRGMRLCYGASSFFGGCGMACELNYRRAIQ